MNTERRIGLESRAAVHAALADPARLQIVDTLRAGDASPSELARTLAMPSNLVAHHLNVLEAQDLVVRRRSEGDRRRTYIHLVHNALASLVPAGAYGARRVLFVCTANSARSHLAAALWRQASDVPSISAGTHPAERIDPRALAAAKRHQLPLRRVHPQRISEVEMRGDLIITVCDLAHEELGDRATLHWSIPDPVRVGNGPAFDKALEGIAQRVSQLAPHLAAS
jgi:ArsR family transcriptional regulator, arsenate/arsenite/antimonite-responsive transcriptional repressor / arsenate reductase (thioredoxin)